MFRHANDEVGLCVYVLPGNPEVTDSTLPKWHEFVMKEDPNVSRSIGKKAKMERMKAGKKAYMLATNRRLNLTSNLLCCCSIAAGPLRCGGEKKTFDDHVLVIGDAAG